ncbi:MAG: ribonuclease III [Verrucomicrobia bacterium]|nr:ribonuclease III [Verrucomicrobiota bacterium]
MSASPTPPEVRLGHIFRDRTLLNQALTHPSLRQEPVPPATNQRLEFLGDAVLQLVLTEALFQAFPGEREGELSRLRATLANGTCLAGLAREAGVDTVLRLSASEEAGGGRARPAALADALEALLGAVFLEAGIEGARRAVHALYGPLGPRLAADEADNPKGRLQERIQPVHGNDALRYALVATEGADHARTFTVTVYLRDQPLGTGRGSSKQAAEKAAAQAALAVT